MITFIDIDKRKRAEDALREREERLRRMVNVEVVGVFITDESGLITECNEAASKMLGYGHEELKSRRLSWLDITPPEDLAATRQRMAALAATGRSELTEKEYVRKDGSRSWMIFTAAALGDGTAIRYCLDVADRKRVENQVIEAERGLRGERCSRRGLFGPEAFFLRRLSRHAGTASNGHCLCPAFVP